jgi:hypothetical protein
MGDIFHTGVPRFSPRFNQLRIMFVVDGELVIGYDFHEPWQRCDIEDTGFVTLSVPTFVPQQCEIVQHASVSPTPRYRQKLIISTNYAIFISDPKVATKMCYASKAPIVKHFDISLSRKLLFMISRKLSLI